MFDAQHSLQPEIQKSLTDILIQLATLESKDKPQYTIITTAPGQWLPLDPSHTATIIDIAEILGNSTWRSERDIEDSVLDRIRAVGWTDECIKNDYRYKSAGRLHRPDVLLVDQSQQLPLAVIEIKSTESRLLQGLDSAKHIAREIGAKFAIATDGKQWLFTGYNDESETSSEAPSPDKLGISTLPTQKPNTSTLNSKSSINRVFHVDELIETLKRLSASPVIVDYTVPWGTPTLTNAMSSFATNISEHLPQKLKRRERIDILAALIALVLNYTAGWVVAVVPRGTLSGSHLKDFRNFLNAESKLKGVLELPVGIFNPIMSVGSAVLVLSKDRPTSDNNVAFLSVPNRGDILQGEHQPWFFDFKSGLKGEVMQQGFSAHIEHDAPWNMSLYHPETKALEERIQNVGPTVRLGDACDVFVGYRHSRAEARSGHGIPIIRGRDISSMPLSKEELTCFDLKPSPPVRCKVLLGDILLQRIAAVPQCLLISQGLEGMIASDTVVIIRPNPERVNPEVIFQFLRSIAGQRLLSTCSRGAGTPTVSISAIRNIPIPLLPDDMARDLSRLHDLEQDLRLHADRLASMRLNVFSAETAEDLAKRVSDIRCSGQSVAASIQQAETPTFRIRNFYPYPLAYAYRTLASLTLPQDLYKEQLRVAENILSFLGSLTLALLPPTDLLSSGLNLHQLWQGGISPGHWQQVCQHGAKALSAHTSNGFCPDFTDT